MRNRKKGVVTLHFHGKWKRGILIGDLGGDRWVVCKEFSRGIRRKGGKMVEIVGSENKDLHFKP